MLSLAGPPQGDLEKEWRAQGSPGMSGVGKVKLLKQAFTMLPCADWRAVPLLSSLDSLREPALKDLGCQFERKNSRLNTRIDIFIETIVNTHLCYFCP